MKIKHEFYKNAFSTIDAELPNIERILNETHLRPVFGECIEDHLNATGRTIAYPILLAVSYLRRGGLNEEGLLFLISPLLDCKMALQEYTDESCLLVSVSCNITT